MSLSVYLMCVRGRAIGSDVDLSGAGVETIGSDGDLVGSVRVAKAIRACACGGAGTQGAQRHGSATVGSCVGIVRDCCSVEAGHGAV